ncbi:MAG: helix-turn-helix transcriptional regulator [Clostridia bacterium]|nr:helix-turn-helix transcriptional regulator [Clostridia bacterium]MBR5427256.1 helix-turn-helix transcriptional regulator [Clostridia bacterium]
MGQNKDDFKRGTAELLVLHLLLDRDLYGYQITQAFEEKTNSEYTMLEGSLYPILYKLEDAGFISSYSVKAGVRRTRKYYRIEDAGRAHYETILRDYLSVTNSILKILGRTEIDEN